MPAKTNKGKEIKEVRKRKSQAATLRNVTSTANKTDGNNLENKQKKDKDLVIGVSKEKDGRQIDLRTSLSERTGSVVKNKIDLEGNKGARKGTIQELIGRFNGGGDGKKPLDRTEEESKSSREKKIIDLGLSIQ